MPWTESDAMDQRLQFVTDALSDRFTMTELCARYGVSRRIGYKWAARFNEDGKRGLAGGDDIICYSCAHEGANSRVFICISGETITCILHRPECVAID